MRVGAITLVVLGAISAASPALACTLYRVMSAEQAELRVYFTRFEREDTTGGRYRDCEVVASPDDDTILYWVTRFRQDANVIVHPDNWPGASSN